jgi:hypothetical protein
LLPEGWPTEPPQYEPPRVVEEPEPVPEGPLSLAELQRRFPAAPQIMQDVPLFEVANGS